MAAKGFTRVSPGQYRDNSTGKIVNSTKKPTNKKPKGALATQPTPQPVVQPAPQPTPEQQITEQTYKTGAENYQKIANQFQNFNPNQMQQQYQPVYGEQMDRYRNSLMEQFDRRNADVFAKERQATQQSIVERGLDPASPAAQTMMKELNDRQDRARQEAMSAAEQGVDARQSQFFGQAQSQAMLPYQQYQAIENPFMAGVGAQYQYGLQGLQGQQQFGLQQLQGQQAIDLQKLQGRQRLQEIKATPRGGSGGGGGRVAQQPTPYDQYMEQEFLSRYGQQGQQNVNPANAAIGGAFQGFTNAVTTNLMK